MIIICNLWPRKSVLNDKIQQRYPPLFQGPLQFIECLSDRQTDLVRRIDIYISTEQ